MSKQSAKEKKKKMQMEEAARKESTTAVEEAKRLLDKGQFAKALEQLDIAVAKNPENSEAYSCKGAVFKEQGMWDQALQWYCRAVDVNPREPSVLCIALSGRAQCYDQLGDKDNAIEDYTTFIEKVPYSDYAYNMRGMVRLSRRLPGLKLKNAELGAVLDDFKKAVELNENNYHAVANLGHALFDHQRYKEAISEYSRALALKDDYYYVLYRRAIAYSEQVMHEEHDEEVEKAKAAELEAEKLEKAKTLAQAPSSSLAPASPNSTSSPGVAQRTRGAGSGHGAALEDSALSEIIADELHEALVRERKHLMRLAIADFTKVILEDRSMRGPEDETCTDAGAFLRRAICHQYLGETERAHEDLSLANRLIAKDEPRWSFIKPIVEKNLNHVRTVLSSNTSKQKQAGGPPGGASSSVAA